MGRAVLPELVSHTPALPLLTAGDPLPLPAPADSCAVFRCPKGRSGGEGQSEGFTRNVYMWSNSTSINVMKERHFHGVLLQKQHISS